MRSFMIRTGQIKTSIVIDCRQALSLSIGAGLLCLLLSCGSVLGFPSLSSSGPQLSLQENRCDFGDAFRGELLKRAFAIRNTGGAPLELTSVSPAAVGGGAALPEKYGIVSSASQGQQTTAPSAPSNPGAAKNSAVHSGQLSAQVKPTQPSSSKPANDCGCHASA